MLQLLRKPQIFSRPIKWFYLKAPSKESHPKKCLELLPEKGQITSRGFERAIYEKSKVSAASVPVSIGNSSGGYENFRKKAKVMNTDSNVVEEYVRYFKLAEVGTNTLSFWNTNQYHYPILSAMAKDYLTIQASSVAAERAFSSGTDLVTPDRCSLEAKPLK